ncbi:MAG: hypothetical protein IPI14_08690, partial [Polaromonas sp.]|nr:hypothetical protein [Polaromonas sp.]
FAEEDAPWAFIQFIKINAEGFGETAHYGKKKHHQTQPVPSLTPKRGLMCEKTS